MQNIIRRIVPARYCTHLGVVLNRTLAIEITAMRNMIISEDRFPYNYLRKIVGMGRSSLIRHQSNLSSRIEINKYFRDRWIIFKTDYNLAKGDFESRHTFIHRLFML